MITGKEQAFSGPSDMGYQPGMDIRTWLAGQAIVGIMSANPALLHNPKEVAFYSIVMAEAVIIELNK